MEIHPSARRHGVADEDIEHAMSNAMATDDLDDGLRLYLGPARDGELLEAVVVRRIDAPQRVIRAMSMRDRYSRLLPGL